jgi:hypothetical protein
MVAEVPGVDKGVLAATLQDALKGAGLAVLEPGQASDTDPTISLHVSSIKEPNGRFFATDTVLACLDNVSKRLSAGKSQIGPAFFRGDRRPHWENDEFGSQLPILQFSPGCAGCAAFPRGCGGCGVRGLRVVRPRARRISAARSRAQPRADHAAISW